jgi:Flp pilus assembly protein TadB
MNEAVVAAMTGLATWAVVRWAMSEGDPPDAPAERRRREKVRRDSVVFRYAERLALAVAAVIRAGAGSTAARVQPSLLALDKEHWRGDEYLAVWSLTLWPLAPLGAAAGFFWGGPFVAVGALVLMATGAPLLAARWARQQAEARVRDLRDRLPHALDLMSLLLEVGAAPLIRCLELAAAENAGNPLGAELGRVTHAIRRGAPAWEALAEMSRRLADPDVTAVNLAVAGSQTHGTPLRDTLLEEAARLRTRRVQWLEAASERARVKIDGPVLLVAVACVTVFAVPFVMTGLPFGRELLP